MKRLYSMALAAMLAGQAMAQTAEKFDNFSFSKLSQDGTWLVENNNGAVAVYNRKTKDLAESSDPYGMQMYMAGLGNCMTNSGKLVGTCGDYAGIFANGTWTYLPQDTGVGTSYNAAHAITPDESRIVGILGFDNAQMGSGEMLAYPVVWTKNEANEYVCQKLPCPTTDFLGKTPQYITAIAISDDGKTVAGQVRDNSGFYTMPIVFKEDNDGNWSYTILGEKDIYDKSRLGELPEVPEQPTYPNVADYMSNDDITNYNAALEKYNEDVNKFFNGEIDTYPDFPMQGDYISDATKKQAYEDAVNQYNADIQAWQQAFTAYNEKLSEITTNCGFVQNALYLSANGKYLGADLEQRSSTATWGEATPKYIGFFDLSSEAPEFTRTTDGGDYLITGILDDATTFVGEPAMEYTRNTFVVVPDKEKYTKLSMYEYAEARSNDMATWLKENNSYDIPIYKMDEETYDYIIDRVVEDSLVAGTVMPNSDGSILLSYYTDNFTSSYEALSVSYVIDFNKDTDGINAIADEKTAQGITINGNNITAGNNAFSVYDMAGRKLTGNAVKGSVDVANGMYIVRSTDGNGNTTSHKVRIR